MKRSFFLGVPNQLERILSCNLFSLLGGNMFIFVVEFWVDEDGDVHEHWCMLDTEVSNIECVDVVID